MAGRAAGQVPVTTLHECFERYKREVLPNLAPRTQKDYLRHIVILDRTFGSLHPDELQPRQIGAFLDRPKGKIQANRQVAVLSAIFAKIVGRWYVGEKNPCRDVERNESKKRDRYVTDREYASFYSVASTRVQLMMDLALLTGQRQGDLISLPIKNVTPEGLRFRQGKTGKRLMVGMSPSLAAVVARAMRLTPPATSDGYLIRTRKGSPYTSEGFRACWQRTMKKAMKRGLLEERFTFHDLRAKCVSDSGTLDEAFQRAGHTSMAMTRGTYDRGERRVTALK